MNKQKSQSGFAHLAIVIILAVALVGTLGFVYWQNFIQKDTVVSKTPASGKSGDSSSNPATATYKTYTDTVFNASFQYPDNWTVGQVNVPLADDPHYNRWVDVKNENGEKIATLTLGVSGLGETCGGMAESDLPTYAVVDSEPTSVRGKKAVALSFMVSPSKTSTGAYNASYGLTDTYTTLGDSHLCLVYDMFESTTVADYGNYSFSFGNGVIFGDKKFASLDDAKQYIASDEYKAIKKMLLSLTY